MPFKEISTTDNQQTDKTRDQQENGLIPGKTTIEPISESDLETQIIRSLEDDVIQGRIKKLLQDIMRDELSKMSVVLKEAVRNWVFKEKQKYNLTPDKGQQVSTDQLEQAEKDRKKLEEENQKLKRALELKEHENKIMLSAVKNMTPKPNKN